MYVFVYLIGLILYIYLIVYVCLLRFLLELKFVFSKIKMFKLLFILFVITFPRKKGCVIKEAVANKEDRHCCTPILGQICGLVS